MVAVPAIERTLVVVGAHADEIRAEVDSRDAEWLVCAEWREGVAASLRAALAALAPDDPEALVITLGDQPLITPQVIAGVLDGLSGGAPATRATYEGRPGHPVLVKRGLFPTLRSLRGDEGARDALAAAGVRSWECGHLCSDADIDTPEDLEAIRDEARAVLRG
jgi:molybdenum cofactor cytidylyltransferase